jgi:hypothetical protein
MGIYILVVIIVMMLAVLVATKDPDGDSEFTKAARKRPSSGSVSSGPGQPLATTVGSSQK